MYKYSKIKIDVNDVVFLEVIKNPFWHNHEERLFNNENLEQLNVGDMTWVHRKYLKNEDELTEDAVCIENNRYYFNFDRSCFKILHTSKQKLKK